jgi:hypothetical protein
MSFMIAVIYARKSTKQASVSEGVGVTRDTSGILRAVFVGRAAGVEGDDA